MKKNVLILFFIIFVVGLAAFFYSRRLTQEVTLLAPTPTPISLQEKDIRTLPVEPVLVTQKNIAFTVSFSIPKFPKELPIYQITSENFSLSKISGVASSLGFSGVPIIEKSGQVTTYEWKKSGVTLTAQDIPPSLSLLQESSFAGAAPNKDDAQKTISQFLEQHNLISSTVQLLLLDSSLLTTEGLNLLPANTLSEANIVSVSYQYTINAYPLFQKSGLSSGVTGLIGSGGTIRSIAVSLLPSFRPTSPSLVFPIEQAIAALQNNKGILVDIENPRGTEASTVDSSFSSVNLTGVSLAYILLPEEKMIKPVFVFSGIAQGGNSSSRGAKVTYFVPASL